jgi:hypothetical protein
MLRKRRKTDAWIEKMKDGGSLDDLGWRIG